MTCIPVAPHDRPSPQSAPERRAALLALTLAASSPAFADNDFQLSGFGTLGYAVDDNSRIAPTRDISQLPKQGARTGGSWRMDSRLGVQMEYRPAANVELVGQAVASDHFRGNADSALQLAYVGVHPDTDVDLRLGRLSYDAFLMSDHRNVSFAYPWVRPPVEFYGWIPIFSLDGVDAAYNYRTDNGILRVKGQLGRSRVWIPVDLGEGGGYRFSTDRLTSFSLSHETAAWRVKAAYSEFRINSEVPVLAPLRDGLSTLAAAGLPGISSEASSLRDDLSFKGTRVRYSTIGFGYDDNRWMVQGEFGHSSTSTDIVPSSRSAYLSAGRRFGNWMPFVLVSVSRPLRELRKAANDWGMLNATVRDVAIQTISSTRIDQESVAVGVRWDFRPNAAFKLQLETTLAHSPGAGAWCKDASLQDRDNRLNQLTATVDFVF